MLPSCVVIIRDFPSLLYSPVLWAGFLSFYPVLCWGEFSLPFQFFCVILFPQHDKETGTLAQCLYTNCGLPCLPSVALAKEGVKSKPSETCLSSRVRCAPHTNFLSFRPKQCGALRSGEIWPII